MAFSFDRPEDSPGFLLWQLTNEWQRKQRRALSPLGLTHTQFVFLASLFWLSTHSTLPVTQNQISELAKMDKMMVSDLVSTLIQKKLILRKPHKTDKRAYALSLTVAGQKKIIKAIPVVEGVDAEFFNDQTNGAKQLNHVLSRLFKR